MKIFKTINLVLLILLGLSSGVSKIIQLPQEMEFFHGEMGFGASAIVLFGLVQLAAGILLVFGSTRTMGAAILALTFLISTVVIFMAGKIGFGVFSILPIVMAGFVIKGITGQASAMESERPD